MSQSVIIGNAEPCQMPRNKTRQRTTCGKDYAEASAVVRSQIAYALPRDCLGLLRHVRANQEIEIFCPRGLPAHFGFAEKRIAERGYRFRRMPSFAVNFFPRADPAKIGVEEVFSRFLDYNGRVCRQLDCCAKEEPIWPMRSIEIGDQHARKF